MEGNLTKGPILKTLTKLAIPIMASSFLGTLYNITDMAWIGLLGSKAVAGVGVGGMFTWLSQGLASMSRMGGVDKRWAIVIVVRFSDKASRLFWICCSLSLSNALVASSKIKIGGFFKKTLAIEILCF